MRIAYKLNDGIVITDVEEIPTSEYMVVTDELENKFFSLIKPDINIDFTDFIESATAEEIQEANKQKVPDTISRMGLKIQLLIKGIEISEIIETINSIPSFMFPEKQKQIAIIKFQEAAYFDRYNADLQLIATLMGLSQNDLDEIFINGNIN